MYVVIVVVVVVAVLAVYWLTGLNSHTYTGLFLLCTKQLWTTQAVCGVTTFIVTIMYNKYFSL